MQYVYSLSLTPAVYDWLANSRHPCILHVFDRACNLINERREVLSIVTPQIGNGPFNLVIENDICFSKQLGLQAPIFIHPNQLNLGDLTITTPGTKLWSPRPDWVTLHAKRNDIILQLMKLPITNYLKLGGFDMPLNVHSGLLNHRQLLLTNYQFSNFLVSAIATADLSSALTAAQKLA